jgi:hypothetical protein
VRMRVDTVGHRLSAIPIANDTVGTKFVSIFDRRHDVITSTLLPGFVWVIVRDPCAVPDIDSAPSRSQLLEHQTTSGGRSSNLFGRANALLASAS